ncbi:MAG TPA: gamma-glutamyltransferase [Fimbriiglobus sp.]|jgi:gamma-glutamyltranspeptidase/glutathione hydrolase
MKYWLTLGFVCVLTGFAAGQTADVVREQTGPDDHNAIGRNGMVVCVSPPAADVGLAILKKGGNAVDAAVAVAFAEAVTWPEAGNLGGGGFMMVWPGTSKAPAMIDYREMAPAKATPDMFANGPIDYMSHKVSGVPGTVRGLALAHSKFGTLPWKDLVAPAAKLAGDGFAMDAALARRLNNVLADRRTRNAEFVRVYGKNGTRTEKWAAGDVLKLPDLAKTLTAIMEKGPDAFYTGAIAALLEKEMRAGGGIMTAADLAAYKAKERTPVQGTYRGNTIVGPPPPSSGGYAVIEALNILENFDLASHPRQSPETVHLIAEAMQRAFADRARHLGDSDFVTVPDSLLSKEYAKTLAAKIDLTKATKSETLAGDVQLATGREGNSTTQFSIVDKTGMAVSNTYTLENSFGNRVLVRGAGYLLNNEMTDFNTRPGVTNRSGSIGTPPNDVAPGKRMLSSMTPLFVAKDGKLLLVTGSPGGRTIINTVLCVVINTIDYDMDARAAVDAPRLHHQWFPDRLTIERLKDNPDLAGKLRAMGHAVANTNAQGDAHTIRIDPKTGMYQGAADKRLDGKAAGY